MNDFKKHSIESAPEESKPILKDAMQELGFIPNLYGALAESPNVLKGYVQIAENFMNSGFDDLEKQIILLTTSVHHHCSYCIAAHSTLADSLALPFDTIKKIRNNEPLEDTKWEALRQFTSQVVLNRGELTGEDLSKFLSHGYTKANILEIILGVAMKVMSNYTNHVVGTPIDAVFQTPKIQELTTAS